MAFSSQSDDEIVGINVTPLVDVMLVLLVIFMVTATYITNQSIDVSLPQASTGENVADESLSVVLDKNSKIYLDGKISSYGELTHRIEKSKKNGRVSLKALIAADKMTPHGTVIKLIDTLRSGGVEDFAMQIEAGK